MRTVITSYSFNKATQQVTFSGLTSIVIENLFMIVDQTNGITIYQTNNPSLGGTASGNVLTLTYNTNTGSFANTDHLQIIYEGVTQVANQDGTTLQSATVSSPATGSSINTTGYNSITISATGDGAGNIYILGSNDNVNWQPLLLTSLDSLDTIDTILNAGNYSLKVSTLYIQYNATVMTGSLALIFMGRSAQGAGGADKLALAMNPENQYPLNVNIQGGIKVDAQGAAIASDAPAPIYIRDLAVGSSFIIDTTGYQSISFTTQSLVANVFSSNDGIAYASVSGNSFLTGSYSTGIPANSNYVFPCMGRYFKVTATTTGTATAYLRASPFTPTYGTNTGVGLNFIANGAMVSAGINGVMPCAGAIAVGAAPTTYPVGMGGIDTSGKTQRILTDTSGRVQLANSSAQNLYNNTALNVQDTSIGDDGSRVIDLLTQILLEMRIMNQ